MSLRGACQGAACPERSVGGNRLKGEIATPSVALLGTARNGE